MDKNLNFPVSFEKRVLSDSFLERNLLTSLNNEAPISVRFNPSKNKNENSELQKVAWCENAFYLKERPIFTLDPSFHAGVYYPQEAGSMFLDKVLKQINLPENPIILDLCAAPGGKSSLIASFLSNKGILVSNEVINSRAKILKENLTKWGFTNTLVSNNDPKDFSRLPDFFDCIVVDAPCSGEGMFRKDKNSREEWSEENVNLCSGRQKRIVKDVWESLKSEGYLIYSTCTFNSQENEENIQWFIENLDCEVINIDFSPLKKDRSDFGAYALPYLVDSEGFYITLLRKKTKDIKAKKIKVNNKNVKILKDISFLSKFVKLENKKVLEWNSIFFTVPEFFFQEIILLQEKLSLIKMGTELGTAIRGELIPDISLALDSEICIYSDKIQLNKENALKYLKGETFELNTSKGFKLVTYNESNLGWIKHIGNRFNNLYPKEWRIRMKI
jgi:16S rRNA C967 or C1407 C5-methylase (RsmB/RsmF family)/NOL1/NOP2/fmu family ribosome biogenesis protein